MKNFIDYNNIEILENDNLVAKVDITDIALNPFNIVHGGLIFSLGDTLMGIMAKKIRKDAVTLNSSINYISPGKGKYLIATCKVIKNGKNICILEAIIKNNKDKLIATMTGTYVFIERI